MDVRQIRYFIEIADAGSFNRAASRLRIAQSALSRQIKQLEFELGADLFERHGRGVHVTESGRLFRDRAEFLMRQLEELRHEVRSQASTPSGELHVGIPTSMRALLTRPVLERFLRAYPGVYVRSLEDTTAAIRDRLLSGNLDLALLSTQEAAPVLNCTPLATESMYLVGPKSSGLSLKRPIPLARLARVDLIMTNKPTSLRIATDRILAEAGLMPRIRAEVNSTILFDLVESRIGYSVISYCGIHDWLSHRAIAAAPIRGFTISWVLATSRERPLSQATRIFRTMLEDEAAAAIRSRAWQSAKLDVRRTG